MPFVVMCDQEFLLDQLQPVVLEQRHTSPVQLTTLLLTAGLQRELRLARPERNRRNVEVCVAEKCGFKVCLP